MAEASAKRLKPARAAGKWADVENVRDLFVDILSRLPVKSIWSSRAVSKHWYGSIRNKSFARHLLAKSREKPCYITCPLRGRRMRLYSMIPGSVKKKSHLNTIAIDRHDQDHMYMISSFNGLICSINHVNDQDVGEGFCDLQIRLINPTTGQNLLLPQGTPSLKFEPSIGVAYGTDEIKVFRIFCRKKIPEEMVFDGYYVERGRIFRKHRSAVVYECEMYSSRSGAWENIGTVPCVPMFSHLSPFRSGHVFVGGKIYWLSSLYDPEEILSVDFEGRFEVIQLPKYGANLKEEDRITEATYLINLHGCLSVVVLHPEYMDVWVWKKSGQDFSWEFVCQDTIPFSEDDLVLAMTSIESEILCVTQDSWCCYNVDTNIWKKVKAKTAGIVNPTVFAFTESILPCNGGGMP